jgi:hypothetical protein
MQGMQRRILAGGGLIAAVALVGATVWPRPAMTTPTVTVYKAPT